MKGDVIPDSDDIARLCSASRIQEDVADKELSEMTDEELKKLNVINRENDRMSGRRPGAGNPQS